MKKFSFVIVALATLWFALSSMTPPKKAVAPNLIISTVSANCSHINIQLDGLAYTYYWNYPSAVLYLYYRKVGTTTWQKKTLTNGNGTAPNPISTTWNRINGTTEVILTTQANCTDPTVNCGTGSNIKTFSFSTLSCGVSPPRGPIETK